MPDKRTLYLGLEPPAKPSAGSLCHHPIIRIAPRPIDAPDIQKSFSQLSLYTHLIFTSKSTVRIFFKYLPLFGPTDLSDKIILAVGQSTASELISKNLIPIVAENETAEGIIEILRSLPHPHPYFFWPHSALSRPVITDYLIENKLPFQECPIYDTLPNEDLPPLDRASFDSVVFTSPSTVDAFIHLYGALPVDKELLSIGPVTEHYLSIQLKN